MESLFSDTISVKHELQGLDFSDGRLKGGSYFTL